MDYKIEEDAMYFMINGEELAALYELPHVQQLAYLRGVRPYMNVKTGLVGLDRGISHQSIAEQLFVASHQGIKSVTYSRAQTRRALAGLERAGLIQMHSTSEKLILKCLLASVENFIPKKAVTKPSAQTVTLNTIKSLENTDQHTVSHLKADIGKFQKADTPHKDNNYLYFLEKFEKFWVSYPLKKSKDKAEEEFLKINPDNALLREVLTALNAQIKNRDELELAGIWVPPWKYPANWLAQHCWKDELTPVTTLERNHAKNTTHSRKKSSDDFFWQICTSTDFNFDEDKSRQPSADNVFPFNCN
ncbi:hypothetical protein ACQUW5_02235 [Legionella sp. CNM-1927-20]|uniref:hypothetical protein n=1 Tax=Legionella sp. CNM-1927-20 TaxID=3422221 RepID=UPI00403B1FB7